MGGQAMGTYKTFKQQATAVAETSPAFQFQQQPILGTPLPAFAPMTGTTPALPTAIPLPSALPTMQTMPAMPSMPMTREAVSPVVSEGEEAVVGMELAASLSNLYKSRKILPSLASKGMCSANSRQPLRI